ncbi:hypothetical protein [Streptomyces sedi]|uniref:Uncharacterized protein n=1 Tax=Streptomyces sedi TaxID=555059 RepID=A0A5C4VA48_9ACTN|nr:hypothetical protein [Streptomyces sedi]TNM32682.1 hypothetical protein FH715_04950 [Streptomyces sedi]
MIVSAATYQRARARDRHAEAVKVAVSQDNMAVCCGNKNAPTYKVAVENGTDRPLGRVCLATVERTVLLYDVLQPHTSDHEHIPGYRQTGDSAIVWRDQDGRWWARDLYSQAVYCGGQIPGIGHMRRVAAKAEHAVYPPA